MFIKKTVGCLLDIIRTELSSCYIKKNSLKSVGKVIRVGFIVSEPETWDKLNTVYDEMNGRDNFNLFIIVVPSSDEDLSLGNKYSYELDFFKEKYENVLPAYDGYGNTVNIKLLNLDYVFYQDPYNIHYPKKLQSDKVAKYTKICYIPYGYTISGNFSNLLLYNRSFFRCVYRFYADNKSVHNTMKRVFGNNYTKGLQKVFNIGYPSLEYYLGLREQEYTVKNITWAPRWTYDKNTGGSHFIEYKDSFCELKKEYTDISFTIRPHPMMFANMVQTSKMTEDEVDDYKELLKKYKIVIDDKSPIDSVIKYTDILISDISSIIPQFFATGKPVIYCRSTLPCNEEFSKMLEGIYVADCWEDVRKYVTEIVSGNDYLQEKRIKILDSELFTVHIGATSRIVDSLLQ
jgi:hypothetical protein